MSSDEAPVALVTGVNRGSGKSIAEELHRRGYRVFALGRTLLGEDWLTEYACDLTDPAQIRSGVGRAVSEAGRVDVCVSNAVDRVWDPIASLREPDWDRLMAVNLSASFHLTKALLPAIRAARGQFVFMGSHAGTHYFEGGAAYSATKAAMKAFVETLLLEERKHGVRACLVSPGAIANLDGDEAAYKMATASVAACVGAIIDGVPGDLVVGEIEIRPAQPLPPPVAGIDRLLYV
ncbi:SDR family oxidoreductase [Nonomuraea helvata]|uniref:SDR family oxidoreductase n=1 Tax=Nonomuraea helvata TaxID=37484 RepID=A0ABV5SAF7_9ACTN